MFQSFKTFKPLKSFTEADSRSESQTQLPRKVKGKAKFARKNPCEAHQEPNSAAIKVASAAFGQSLIPKLQRDHVTSSIDHA